MEARRRTQTPATTKHGRSMTLDKLVQLSSSVICLESLAMILTDRLFAANSSRRRFLFLDVVGKELFWWRDCHVSSTWPVHVELVPEVSRLDALALLRVTFQEVEVVFDELLLDVVEILLRRRVGVRSRIIYFVGRRFHP